MHRLLLDYFASLRPRRIRSRIGMAVTVLLVLLLLIPTGVLVRSFSNVVTTLNDNGPGSLSWDIALANPGSTITFEANLRGTILLTSGGLFIAKNLTIRGPGAGILSISGGERGAGVFVEQRATVTISGLTFKGSIFNTPGNTLTLTNSTVSGGGIFNQPGSTLTLSNSTVSGNAGGGIFNEPGSTLTLTNSIVSGNAGGGIYNDPGSTLTLSNSTVSGNAGGGIFNDGRLMLSNSTVSGNTSSGVGGISNAGTLTLSNSIVSGNTVTGSGSEGGGIYNGGTLTLTNTTVSGNRSSGVGGGIANANAKLTLTNSTISDNTASSNGGGIAISDDTSSGQIPSSALLLYCTVYGNTAGNGGGIWVGNHTQGRVTIGASIVARNKAHTAPDIAGSLASLGYNLVGDRSGATFSVQQSTDVLGVPSPALGIDPLLRDNGGLAKPHTWTHALLPGSPAIDAIPLQDCQVKGILNSRSRMYTDQRGMKRPDENESACDIGAYEYVDSA